MTSRERVFTTFDHREPDRVPLWVGCSAEFWAAAKAALGVDDEGLRLRFGDDFRRVFAREAAPAIPLAAGVTARTVFGIERQGLGYGQPINHPLADATLDAVEAYPWPDPARLDVSHLRAEALAYGGAYALLGGDWSPFWHDAIDLFGMEGIYYQMYDAPQVVDAVLQQLVDYYAESSRRIFDAAAGAIDIFFIGNDLGSQTGPLLGVELFQRFLHPHLQRLIALGHDYGLKVMMHCCGGITPLIPQLIAIELDALHAVQPSCCGMNLSELKQAFGRQIVFNGAIDSQHILIDGVPDFVRAQTRAVLDIMAPGGGYIAGASHDSILEETPLANVLAMCETVQAYRR